MQIKKYLINSYSYLSNKFSSDILKAQFEATQNVFKKKGILFRKGPGVKGFENYCRFSLGSIPQIKKVLKVIKYVSR